MMRRNDIFTPDMTVKAEWDGKEYDCIAGGVDRGKRQFAEATLENTTSTARFWLADFPYGPPAIGDRLTISAEVFRILDSHRFGPFIKYALGGEYGRK